MAGRASRRLGGSSLGRAGGGAAGAMRCSTTWLAVKRNTQATPRRCCGNLAEEMEKTEEKEKGVAVEKGAGRVILKTRPEGSLPQHTASEVAELEMIALLRTVVLAKVMLMLTA